MKDSHHETMAAERKDGSVAGVELPPSTGPPSEEAPVHTPPQPDPQPRYSFFTHYEKIGIVMGAAAGAFFSPLTAQIYLPALNTLAEDFHVSGSQINLTVTTYMIFQGLTPMFIGSFADATGRRPAYLICFTIYIAANIGCALAPSYPALLVLRMLQSAGSSTTVALCQAVVADVVTSAERGNYVAYTSLPILLAPAIGPVLGGALAQYLGWRWIFWFLAIVAGGVALIHAFFLPETCRNIVGDGSVRPPVVYRTIWQQIKDSRSSSSSSGGGGGGGRRKGGGGGVSTPTTPTTTTADDDKNHNSSSSSHVGKKKINILQSLHILFETEMFLLLAYASIFFSGFYCIMTSIPSQFSSLYGFNDVTIGLAYLPLAGGTIVSAIIQGKLVNWNYRRHCSLLGLPYDRSRQQDLSDFPIERCRLEVGLPMLGLATAVILCWGWVLEKGAHIAVPCVLLFLGGLAVVGFSNTVNTLIVDINPGNAGAATASNNLTRCLVGACATAAIGPMIEGVGSGWSFFIVGALYVVGAPTLWVIMRNGMRWRREKAERERVKEKRLEGKRAAAGVAEEGAVVVQEGKDDEKA